MKVPFGDLIQNLTQAPPNAYPSGFTGIENFFLFRVPMNPKKDGKEQLERPHFFKVQSGKMKVDQN